MANGFSDPTIRHLQSLQPTIALPAFELVRAARSVGVPLWISDAVRSEAQQRVHVQTGASRTLRSKHLTGEAFDVDVLGFGRDEIPVWWWYSLGSFAEQLGLRWGGRWTGLRDYGHFEVRR